MSHLLLMGAGFSHNWDGMLAAHFFDDRSHIDEKRTIPMSPKSPAPPHPSPKTKRPAPTDAGPSNP